jgi:chromate transporter
VFFGQVDTVFFGPVQMLWPHINTLQPLAVGLAAITGVLLLWRKWPLPLVLLISAAMSLGATTISGTM